MDYTEFFHFMCCIARNRIQSLDMFKKQHLVLHANINMHSEIVENLPDSSCDETNSETQSESAPCCFKEDTIFVSLEAIPTNIVSTLSEPSVSKHHKYIHKTDPAEQQWEAPNKYSSREPFSCHTSTVVSCREGFHRAEEWDKTKSYRMCKCPGKRTSPLPTSVCFESVLVLSESLTTCKNKRQMPHWAKCSVSHALFDLTRIHSILNEMACWSLKDLLSEKKKMLEALSESIQDILLNFGIKF